MKSWRQKFQAMAMAVAFAEAGDTETAKYLVNRGQEIQGGRAGETKKRRDQRPRKPIFRT
ncbi:MAG TPA: hypothetical protein VK463_15185 [Desulfomonilaceae bacterium]|nr:hypothetical protein [Desulfomonilaceae bacterium]